MSFEKKKKKKKKRLSSFTKQNIFPKFPLVGLRSVNPKIKPKRPSRSKVPTVFHTPELAMGQNPVP